MAKFLDLEGLNYFWEKIKSWVLGRFAYKSDLNQKLNTLISGQNIKTINNESVLGFGNIEIESGAVNSVNGKAGDVVLNAEDVGALPDSTTIPTKVSDLTNDSNFSSVSIDRKVSTGTNIADITIDGTTTLLYAPTSGGGGGASAFIAEFGVTPYADIKDAYDEDVVIICAVNDSGNTAVCLLAYFDNENGIFHFTQQHSDGFYLATIASNDIWDDSYFYLASTDTATEFSNGLMSASDWLKLDGIESGAEVNVQSDWNQTTTTADDYIKNKPTIPTVPTNVSAFNNDAGYLTSHQDISGKENTSNKVLSFQSTPDDTHYPSEKLVKDSLDAKQDTIDSSHKLSADLISDGTTNKVINVKPDWNAASGADAEILNKPTIPAAGIPSGGNASQVLKKVSATDYDVTWANQSETLPSAYCTTSGSTAAKKANCSLYVTQANQYLQVLIGSPNTYQGALTLNINSAGDKPIYINGTVSSSTNYTLPNGTYFVFYDGTNYYFRTDGKIQGPDGILYNKPSTGIPASDLASGVIPTVPVQDVTVGGTSVVSSGTAAIPAIPTVPTISTDVATDKADNTKTTGAKAVYDAINPAIATTEPSGGMLPNVLYQFGELSGNTTFTLATPSDNTIANHYYWTFDTPSTAPTITWPTGLTWFGGSAPTISASKHYEISVLNGIAIAMEV